MHVKGYFEKFSNLCSGTASIPRALPVQQGDFVYECLLRHASALEIRSGTKLDFGSHLVSLRADVFQKVFKGTHIQSLPGRLEYART